MKLLLFLLLTISDIILESSGNQFKVLKQTHQPKELSTEDNKLLASLGNVNNFNEILNNILIPRVVGTPNHEKVFKYIVNELEKLKWTIEVDEFVENTPNFGQLTFKNIVAKLNPNANRFLVLACHYDSKYFKNIEFLAATDSAVPCAMMLNLANTLKKQLEANKNNDISLKFIFFDGEEAFKNWGPTDSIYGAKHLATKWENSLTKSPDGENLTTLDRIDVLVLLDLIGAKNPTFYSYWENTDKWFLRLADIEDTLAGLGLLKKWNANRRYFPRLRGYGAIEDDHIPFLRRGVPILHLITTPFPKEWHTEKDNKDIIDINTVENLNKILRIFVAEYLHLSNTKDLTLDKEL